MFLKTYILLSLIADAVLSLFCFDLGGIGDCWIPIVFAVLCFISLIILHIIITFTIFLFIRNCERAEKPIPFFKFWVENSVEMFLTFSNLKIDISGMDKVPDRPFLLVSNHRSNFDPTVLFKPFSKYDMIFVSKPENFEIPVAGSFIKKCAYLAIDRENARNAMRTLKTATEYVQSGGSVCIYPEGTRSKTAELLDFKDGVFYVAKKSCCPIVVLTTENTEKIAKNAPFKRTEVKISVLGRIDPEEFEQMNTHEISDKVRKMMLNKLGK